MAKLEEDKPQPKSDKKTTNEDVSAGRRRAFDEAVKDSAPPEPPEEKGVKKGGA